MSYQAMKEILQDTDKQAIGTKTGIDKLVISKAVLNQKPVIEFIERMRARGFNVETDGVDVYITGDNLEAYHSEVEMLATDITPEEKERIRKMLIERYQISLL